MERKNAKSSIYLRCNNKYKSSRLKQAWGPSCEYDDHDHDHDHDDDGCEEHHDGFYYRDHHHGDGGMMMMMAWPPRSYTCSFCKREFRSAQALGGHMNVHRRDRAQLRQLSQQISPTNLSPNSPLHLNLNLPPNPNYNPNNLIHSSPLPRPSNPAQKIQPPPPTSRLVARSHPPAHDIITRKQFECFRRKNNLVGLRRQEYNHEDVGLKKGGGGGLGIIRLDSEMNGKEDLDLELRLGYK